MPMLVLLGDSTLDNYYWVQKGETVTEQLGERHPEMTVINLAVDGFTTDSVLKGNFRDVAVQSSHHKHKHFEPLTSLAKKKDVRHIVLSVLANDFPVRLRELILIPPEQRPEALNNLIASVTDNYVQIVNTIRNTQPNAQLTILLQYTPHIKNDLYLIYFFMLKLHQKQEISEHFLDLMTMTWHQWFEMSKEDECIAVHTLHTLMAKAYQEIFRKLANQSFAVVDLSSSFDYQDSELYLSQIEPSKKGAHLIAFLISHVINTHDFSQEVIVYSLPPNQANLEVLCIPLKQIQENWFPGRISTNQEHALPPLKY